jgi:hypothetical protein
MSINILYPNRPLTSAKTSVILPSRINNIKILTRTVYLSISYTPVKSYSNRLAGSLNTAEENMSMKQAEVIKVKTHHSVEPLNIATASSIAIAFNLRNYQIHRFV